MSTEIITDADAKMGRAVDAMERDFQGIRTGRASTALVERIHVEYYGTSTPLNQLAGISVPEPHQIVIQPWDRGVLGAIEKAITKSDIGLMPNVDGTVVRLNIPPLTEERRKDLVQGRPQADGRGPGRDPEPPARCRRRTSRRRSVTATSGPTRPIATSSCSSRRPTATSPRSTASGRPRNRRSSRSSGPRTVWPARPTRRQRRMTRRPPELPRPSETGQVSPANLAPDDLPRHVAIIMDGNRRWARQRDLPELEGHAAGVEAIRSSSVMPCGAACRS